MARLIILPAGISFTRNLKEQKAIELSLGKEAVQLKPILSDKTLDLQRLSVELSILAKLNVTSEDKVVFLATDTDDAECAASANLFIAQQLFNLEARARRVKGLVLDNAQTFLKEGLRNFFQDLDKLVEEAFNRGYEPVLGIAGGIKPVIPYAAVYGMLRGVPLVYVFEQTQALVYLPPLPIDFDWEVLEQIEQALAQIDEQVTIPEGELRALLGEDFPRVEGLFMEYEGGITLSAFGHMLLEGLRRAPQVPVMLSPSASEKLQRVQGAQREELELLLDRIRNPIWRAQKRHWFQGTDLKVFLSGHTPYRLAVCAVKNDIVYVAEIYTEHEHYERDLPKRRREQYDLETFTVHMPNPPVLGKETLEEAKGDELLALALQRQKIAEGERDQALQIAEHLEQEAQKAKGMVEQYQREVEGLRAQVKELEGCVAELRGREEERRSWRLWRRLRWAIFGS